MPKKKHKVVRYQVSFNELQKKMLDEMMLEDAQTEASDFISFCMVNEYKHRQELKTKRPQGRPRKGTNTNSFGDEANDDSDFDEYADDLPKNIPYYGTNIGEREYRDKQKLQESFKPKG